MQWALSPVPYAHDRMEFFHHGEPWLKGANCKQVLCAVGNPLESVVACYLSPLKYMMAPRIFQAWVWSQSHKMSGKEMSGNVWAQVFGFLSGGERWLALFKQNWSFFQPRQCHPFMQRSWVNLKIQALMLPTGSSSRGLLLWGYAETIPIHWLDCGPLLVADKTSGHSLEKDKVLMMRKGKGCCIKQLNHHLMGQISSQYSYRANAHLGEDTKIWIRTTNDPCLFQMGQSASSLLA